MRVLGVDPGLTRCGVGVVEGEPGRPPRLVAVGVITTPADLDHARRLLRIDEGLDAWVGEYAPDAIAVERVFADSNVLSVMGTAQAAGLDYDSAEVQFVPQYTQSVDAKDAAEKLFKLLDAIEDLDDVQNVYSNEDVPDEILEQLEG